MNFDSELELDLWRERREMEREFPELRIKKIKREEVRDGDYS